MKKQPTKTDNSHFQAKVNLRLDNLPDKKKIRVLDCFGGKGAIWNAIKARSKSEITVIQIEKEKGKNSIAIQGDNLKILPALDLSRFDVIDLDSYGVPDKQIEIIKARTSAIIFFTAIIVGAGIIPKAVLQKNHITQRMIVKCPTIFRGKFELLWTNYLIQCFPERKISYIKYDTGAVKLYGIIK